MAGINAGLRVQGKAPVVIDRTRGYTGILIDDLVSKGADEPYRMFTSRAEFRLHLRIDNADERLTPIGRRFGLVDDTRWALFTRKQAQKDRYREILQSNRLAEWLRRPESKIAEIAPRFFADAERGVLETLETEIKYSGYIAQQERQVNRIRASESRSIPVDFSYTDLPGLSREVQEKLARVRPGTLGQAGRIPGVTHAA